MDNPVKAPAINPTCPNGKALNPRYIKAMVTVNISRNDCIFILWLYPCFTELKEFLGD